MDRITPHHSASLSSTSHRITSHPITLHHINHHWLLIKSQACNSLGRARLFAGNFLNLRSPSQYEFLWVVDFPLFAKYDVIIHHATCSTLLSYGHNTLWHADSCSLGQMKGKVVCWHPLLPPLLPPPRMNPSLAKLGSWSLCTTRSLLHTHKTPIKSTR